MKKSYLFLCPFLFTVCGFLLIGCGSKKSTKPGPPSGNLTIERFPAEVGNSWEYRRMFYSVIYDAADGHIIEEDLHTDSLHCEFLRIDTLRGWECYKYGSQLFQDENTFSDTVWYAHPDTAFLTIAYTSHSGVGPPPKSSGEIRLKFGERYFNNIGELKLYLYQMRNSVFASTSSDTTFLEPPRKLFIFPLTVGTQWVASVGLFGKIQEREVVDEESVHVQAGDFVALKVRIITGWPEQQWYQWITGQGIIKDSAHLDAIPLYGEFGELIGYVESYDKYELISHGTTGVKDESSDNQKPTSFSLAQNYPNP